VTELSSVGRLIIEPVVRWPREAISGQEHLVEADLRVTDPPPELSPSEQSEMTFSFVLDGAPYLQVRSMGNPTVAVERSGETTGPVRFVVTPRGPSGRRVLHLTLCSGRGLPLRTDELAVDVTMVAEEAGAGQPGAAGDSFTTTEEERSWRLAENLSARAQELMRLAEEATEAFRTGRLAMRRQFKARGLSEVEADIRWAGSTAAMRARTGQDWYIRQARMYLAAARVQYARARYLGAGSNDRVAALPDEQTLPGR